MAAYPHSLTLPWTVSDAEKRRFHRIVAIAVAVTLLLGGIIPLLPVDRQAAVRETEVSPRIAKLIIEKRELRKPRPVEKPKPEPEPEPVKKETPPPEKKVEEKPRAEAKPKPKKPPKVDTTRLAREKARKSGLLAMSDSLADLRDQSSVDRLKGTKRLSNSGSTANKTERRLVAAKVSDGSKGIDTSSLTRDTGKTRLADRTATKVQGPVYDGGSGDGLATASGPAARSDEEIQVVFDKNKSAIYSLYNRELRRNPSLQGKVVIRLTIAPSGRVTDIELVSSQLNLPRLENKLLKRIKLFNFGAKSVESITVTYPIQFLPA